MKKKVATLDQIRTEGLNLLADGLGPVKMIRFLQQFETGKGDYTRDRHKWLTNDLETLIKELEQRR